MNKYIYLNNLNIVWEILDEFNSEFPEIPIEERYTKQFLDSCLIFDEEEFNQKNIFLGMTYNRETNSFYYPESKIEKKEEIVQEEQSQKEEIE